MREIHVCFMLIFVLIQSSKGDNHNLYLSQALDNYLEFNWDYPADNVPDKICLTAEDIRKNANAQVLYAIYPGNVTHGNHKTNQLFSNNQSLPGNWEENSNLAPILTSHCFNFYISSFSNGNVLQSRCFGIEPTWMKNFGELRIGNMTIPGSHDTGAFESKIPAILQNYVITQDRNLYHQLVYGIRYFDLRIGRYGNKPEDIYINHDVWQCTPFLPQLQSVLNFVKKSPKEIVVLNFHRFPYPADFLPAYHKEILDLVAKVLDGYILPFNKNGARYGPKLNEIWMGGNKRIIISYNDNQAVRENTWLWPTVNRAWANVEDKDQLENYIRQQLAWPINGSPMAVIMAELTPSADYIVRHFDKNLKDLAHLVNGDLASLLFEQNRINNLNIIATDFFTGNDCISNAIESNVEKLKSV